MLKPVFDAYVDGRLCATYQSLNRANAALQRAERVPISMTDRSCNFVVKRIPVKFSRAPWKMILKWRR